MDFNFPFQTRTQTGHGVTDVVDSQGNARKPCSNVKRKQAAVANSVPERKAPSFSQNVAMIRLQNDLAEIYRAESIGQLGRFVPSCCLLRTLLLLSRSLHAEYQCQFLCVIWVAVTSVPRTSLLQNRFVSLVGSSFETRNPVRVETVPCKHGKRRLQFD